MLFDKKDVAARWEEYVRELYDDPNRKEKVQINGEEGPDLLKSEVELAIKVIKAGKAPGVDKIFIEHLKALTLSVFEVHLWTHQKNFSKNRNFLELSQSWYRAYFKHADYEYEHDFLKFCL